MSGIDDPETPILITDTGPLLRFAAAQALNLILLGNRQLIIPDMVFEEAVRLSHMPFATDISDWIEQHRLAIEIPITAPGVAIAALAQLTTRDAGQERLLKQLRRHAGERAIQDYLQNLEQTPEHEPIILFEDRAVPTLVGMAGIATNSMNTAAYIDYLAEIGLIADKKVVIDDICRHYTLSAPITISSGRTQT